MEGVGRDFIDNSLRTPYERLRNDFEKQKNEIIFQDRQLRCEISFSFENDYNESLGVAGYYLVHVRGNPSDDVGRLVLSACKQAHPLDIIFVEYGTKMIGVGPNNKKYSSDVVPRKHELLNESAIANLLFADFEYCQYTTYHRYYIGHPQIKMTQTTYNDGTPYFDFVYLQTRVDDLHNYLWTQEARWEVTAKCFGVKVLFYYSRLLNMRSMLEEAESLHIQTMMLHHRFHTKFSLVDFMREECNMKSIEVDDMVLPNSLFSLYCQYVIRRQDTLFKHRNCYRTFVSFVRELVAGNHILRCGSLPNKDHPYIYKLLCTINYLLRVKKNFQFTDLPEVGVSDGKESYDYAYTFTKDVVFYFNIKSNTNTSYEDFIEWYNIKITQYNAIHPFPFYQRIVFPCEQMEITYQYIDQLHKTTLNKSYCDIDKELEKCLVLLENVSVEQYFLDLIYTVTQTTPLLLTRKNELFNPTLWCENYFSRRVEGCVTSILQNQKSEVQPCDLLVSLADKETPSSKKLFSVLDGFKEFEREYFAFHDLELRIPQYDIGVFADGLLRHRDVAVFQNSVNVERGLPLFFALDFTLQQRPNEYGWIIKDDERKDKLCATYTVSRQGIRFTLCWVE
ncbi:hypothetical protein EIN_187310 [Entamoeba invadens IP1]|uniref:hypothetical protein n=1 Tax=Entamoeba invadens IP1 TaxID=370355 RepID=UPI0002C3D7B7|nr:hypothetical protein EIN_187310 [Entamoeba invadens IP1]ELP94264.1 hypothetical protein EIN_187310 [Entamoeba invadens IP1]|eukprot:XP_004261035.1 hypothetical protein EIN_187310 [Entamoeba invadens IP1]